MYSKLRNRWNGISLEVKVTVSYAICSILQRCLSFITIPLFTRLLTTEQYGQYTIYTSWSGILIIFVTLNLAYGSFSTAMVKYENRRDEYISSIEGICLILAGIFLLLYLPYRNIWNTLFELPTFFVLIMILEILASTAIQFWSGKKRFEFKYKSVITVTLLTSIVSPCLAFLFVISTEEKGYARILGYALTTIAVGGTFYIYNIIKGKKIFNKEFWKYAFGFNVPLLAYYISQVIFNQSDRIMISHYCGKSKAAMYGLACNLAMVLIFVLNAINNAYVPWFYGKIKEGKQSENKTISCVIAMIMALMLLCVIWYAPEIILIMAGKEYSEAIWVVAPVSMSLLLLFYAQLFINVEFYYEEKKALVVASIGAALINIVLNALFIPKLGFIAAGYTTLVSYIIFSIANYFAMRKVLKKRDIDEDSYDLKKLIGIFVIFTAASFLGLILYNYLIIRIIITIAVFLVIVYFRKTLIGYIRLIRG